MKLELAELKLIIAKSDSTINELGVIKESMANTLDSINNNIKSDKLVNANIELYEKLLHNLTSIYDNIILINDFANKQVDNYSVTMEEALERVNRLINTINSCIDENSNIVKSYSGANVTYTKTSEYDLTNLRNFLYAYEGGIDVTVGADGKEYYTCTIDTDGSITAGPGLHINHISGIDASQYGVGSLIPKDIVDKSVDGLLMNTRQNIENELLNPKYESLKLSDSQVDSLTSLLYNTGKQPSYFLDRYVDANASGISLYDFTTKYWVNANNQKLDGLVIRRAGEAVLAEQGYDAWLEWSMNHPLGSSTSNLGI